MFISPHLTFIYWLRKIKPLAYLWKRRLIFPDLQSIFFLETASYVWGKHLIGIILTGANNDGASGLRKNLPGSGGLAIIQSPESAEVPIMPMSAMDHCPTALILPLNDIPDYLNKINQ